MQPAPPKRPARENAPPSRPRTIKPVGSDLLGVFILAGGIAALIGVIVLAYFVFFGPTLPDAGSSATPPGPAQNQTSLSGLDAARIPKEEELQGVWDAPFSSGHKAIIAFHKGNYQILLADKTSTSTRLYSIGSYTKEGHSDDGKALIISLQPDPNAQAAPAKGLSYEVLTLRKYKIAAGFNPDNNRLFIQSYIQKGLNDQIHPLFFYTKANETMTGWTRRQPTNAATKTDRPPAPTHAQTPTPAP